MASAVPLQPVPSVDAAIQASTSPVSLSLHPHQPQQGWGLEVRKLFWKKYASLLLFLAPADIWLAAFRKDYSAFPS